MAVQGFLRYTANVEWFKEGRGEGTPFSKGRRNSPGGEQFLWRGQGEGEIPLTKGSEIPLAGRHFSWRAQGGFRISPLRALQTTRNPLKRPLWGLAAPGAGPPPQHSAEAS